ncbi:hypothetical protein [Microseira wollei]|uniref:hypothetical protein n=1 Tax=Microseira wollei TaxID=467598 RepID=UPI001CFE82AD|nr:hypothetical protein [Microseira wollei]
MTCSQPDFFRETRFLSAARRVYIGYVSQSEIACHIMSGRLPILRSRDTALLTLSVCPRYRQMPCPYATTL